jgi:hypothetical protein
MRLERKVIVSFLTIGLDLRRKQKIVLHSCMVWWSTLIVNLIRFRRPRKLVMHTPGCVCEGQLRVETCPECGYPECGYPNLYHHIGWRPGWNKRGKRRKQQCRHSSLFPGRHNISSSAPPSPPHHNELKPLKPWDKINNFSH